MKILARVLIIVIVFSIFSALIVTAVNASGANAPGQFRPEGNGDGFRPDADGNRPERGEGGPRWLSGVIKNVGVIALLVTAIVWPKSIVRKNKRKAVAQTSSKEGE